MESLSDVNPLSTTFLFVPWISVRRYTVAFFLSKRRNCSDEGCVGVLTIFLGGGTLPLHASIRAAVLITFGLMHPFAALPELHSDWFSHQARHIEIVFLLWRTTKEVEVV